ncbi:plasmid stabilization system protein, RelE/ParE family [Mobiluncus mulieris 28-1]|uniref:type II toxin-antitoxin system RelE/ParE family toxin n=1 Tax=Mobiluncus mulieris TaxID=2052 RepID=UPI00019F917A|nr:type II toxin-antitoxin system RelE/ParE family toxin [Mobiluncus mulieris]EEJ53569.1 plasmid stabilization system protein, RelE/ParE family [Mobiluncus mulieris ATCC 35243]EEZ91409.1 plasmid stabilization system protein, RelE/ParE family [Mobiluncus mulieris 28-1]SPX70870.1 Plasmid stabilisation system protein [Mobiluncus mulieris]
MSDIYRVIYAPLAYLDLRDIYAYIALDLESPDAAQNQIDRIQDQVSTLEFMPYRHAVVDWEPWRSQEVHRLPVNRYVVFYTIDEPIRLVTVIRVVYSGRNLLALAARDG